MLHSTSLVLVESTDARAVLEDPANQDWLAVVRGITGEQYELVARRYYLALYHLRQQGRRPALPGRSEVNAAGKEQALQGMLLLMEERKKAKTAKQKTVVRGEVVEVFVDVLPDAENDSLPEALRDFSMRPPALDNILRGRGRPPADALCMMRAFLAAPLLGGGDSPRAVYRLLRSNPTFARACDLLGRAAQKPQEELTSRRLPGLSTLEEFSEVMTRYGLWQHARIEQVRDNLETGIVEIEDTLALDTTHMEANSHCGNVVPANTEPPADGKSPKHRKIPRMRKSCGCGKKQWENCEHPWNPTDEGAAVVVKGPTRIHWAHKASVAAFGNSEIPLDARVLLYAAEHDGKTLVPHLALLQRDFPEVIERLRHVLADDAYQGIHEAVAFFGQKARLHVPVHPNGKSKAAVAGLFEGIDRFTPIGVPVCEAGHRFEMRGRDIIQERYIWVAPNDDSGQSVCAGCPFSQGCLNKGTRRHIRVDRKDFPQIDWDNPEHMARNRARYQARTGVERAIKRLKVDLGGEHLTHRDAHRVQAHLDRKLLTLHLLLKSAGAG